MGSQLAQELLVDSYQFLVNRYIYVLSFELEKIFDAWFFEPLGLIEEFNDDDLRVGAKIEEEHARTVAALKKNPKMSDKAAFKSIRNEHLEEHKKYYDKKKGLPAMEKSLEKSKS